MIRTAPLEARAALAAGAAFYDVRPRASHARDGLPGSRPLPLEEIRGGARPEVGEDEPVYLLCERGAISELAGLYLERDGFRDVRNVAGGLEAMRRAGAADDGSVGSP